MKDYIPKLILICLVLVLGGGCSMPKQTVSSTDIFINGDELPDAPELAKRGSYKVGVRTMEYIHKNQVDVLKSKQGIDPLYDRTLKIEVWYPAIIPAKKSELTTYQDFFGSRLDSTRPLIPFVFQGRALRDALPDPVKSYPLIIVSHGYTGSRVLLSYLTENLASKGFVVVAIDHTESTHQDQGGLASTLLNRSKDILFILNQMAEAGKPGTQNFLSGLVDVNNTALIGYSMGGYGVLNAGGAGYSDRVLGMFSALSGGSKAISVLTANNAGYKELSDPRIKAIVTFAPWGMQRGIWDEAGLKGLKIPVFIIAGDQDDISGYEDGIKAIYKGAVNSYRYLLTYENARHNVAPNPPPVASFRSPSLAKDYEHYSEPAWNERRINNINQHFVSAFLGIYLQQKDYKSYLDIPEKPNAKAWTGFKPRACLGLELLQSKPLAH